MANWTGMGMGLKPGTWVLHQRFGVGQVRSAGDHPDSQVAVAFSHGLETFSLRVAERALRTLPADGFSIGMATHPEEMRAWAKSSPLRLIAAVLADLRQPVKPSEIRDHVAPHGLPESKWESWWKKVQPAIGKSSSFNLKSDGRYELVASPGQAIDEPVVQKVDRKRTSVAASEIPDLADDVLAGDIGFNNLPDAESLRKVARILFGRPAVALTTRRSAIEAMQADVPRVKALLEEAFSAKKAGLALRLLRELSQTVQQMLAETQDNTPRGQEKRIIPRMRLASDAVKRLKAAGVEGYESEAKEVIVSVTRCALSVWRDSTAEWRQEVFDAACEAVGSMLSIRPPLVDAVGTSLTDSQSGRGVQLAFVDAVLARIPAGKRKDMIDRLGWAVRFSPAAFSRAMQSLASEEERLDWAANRIQALLEQVDRQSLAALVPLVAQGEPSSAPEKANRLLVALAYVAGDVRTAQSVAESLKDWFANVDVSSIDEASEGNALGVVARACLEGRDAAVTAAIALHVRRNTDLELQVAELAQRNREQDSQLERLRDWAEQVARDHRRPEQWVEFRARTRVLREMARMHQDVYSLSLETSAACEALNWVLARIENGLALQGVELLGKVGDLSPFDPAIHAYLDQERGPRRPSVEVVCPGFRTRNPDGEWTIVLPAQVQ